MDDADDSLPEGAEGQARRRILRLGAGAAVAAITIRPALAQTAVSVLNCQIAVPGPSAAGQYVAPDGRLVPPGTPGAFPPAGRTFTGEEVRRALKRQGTLPGTAYDQNDAYLRYIGRLQQGQSGFTCFNSLLQSR